MQLIALILLLVLSVVADDKSHRFKEGERVYLYVNKIGPYSNPQETYKFYDLPFCKAETLQKPHREGLGEAILSYELLRAPETEEIYFKRDIESAPICTKNLEPKELDLMRKAIARSYWYQVFLDDLPAWVWVGEATDEGEDAIFTHNRFVIFHNQDRLIEYSVTSENLVPLDGRPLNFTYSVKWEATTKTFRDRFSKYLDNQFFEHQIHWFSIFNSFMMVIFLVGLVLLILLRTLKADLARYHNETAGEEGELDDSGWKQVHGDVFRAPDQLELLCATVGTGTQLLLLSFLLNGLALTFRYYKSRGTALTAFVLCYCLTSLVNGYVSGAEYSRQKGKNKMKVLLLSAGGLPALALALVVFLNFFAYKYHSLNYVPVSTMFVCMGIWIALVLPLNVAGNILGRNWSGQANNPCRINAQPRGLPDKPWYLAPPFRFALAGLLPFGGIFIELYFVFTSFWNYKYYYVYGFALMVLVILTIVTLCVSVVSTYMLLNAEDYHWQWNSVLSGTSTSIYVFLYSIYYFHFHTKMSGVMQTAYYFGYTFLLCVVFGLLCSAVAFSGAHFFVHRIYRNVKID